MIGWMTLVTMAAVAAVMLWALCIMSSRIEDGRGQPARATAVSRARRPGQVEWPVSEPAWRGWAEWVAIQRTDDDTTRGPPGCSNRMVK
jgi:hypothetical protein